MQSIIRNIRFLVPVFIILAFPAITFPSQFISRKSISIAKSEQIDDDIYLFSNYAKIYGLINGDLSAFCYEINTLGDVNGNVNLFGYRVNLNGKVEKTSRLFGYMVDVNGEVDGNLLALGNDLSVGEKALIKRDANLYGQKITIDGTVDGNLKFEGANVVISGTVNGDVSGTTEKLMIVPPAVIKGNLNYTSKTAAVIENGAIIQGQTNWKLPQKKEEEAHGFSFFSAFTKFLMFVMALITGLVIISLFKNHTRYSVAQIDQKFGVTFAIGCLVFMICTAGAAVMMILIIGIPLGIFLVGLGVILFYIGKIYVSIFLGRIFLKLFNKTRTFALIADFILGLIILTILFQIPYLGWIIYVFTFLLGMGAAVSGYINLCRKQEAAAATAVASTENPSPAP